LLGLWLILFIKIELSTSLEDLLQKETFLIFPPSPKLKKLAEGSKN